MFSEPLLNFLKTVFTLTQLTDQYNRLYNVEHLSLFLISMFLTISLEAAAAFISAKARLSFSDVMSNVIPLELSFRSLLLVCDISVFGL